jgi:mono/diheme cytochrome c family protein
MKKILVYPMIGAFLLIAFLWRTGTEASEYDQGKNLYENRCQMCHGVDGKGNGPAASAFSPRPANFTDPRFWQRKEIDQFITNTVENGHGMMPPIALKPNEIKAVIDYITHTFKPGK